VGGCGLAGRGGSLQGTVIYLDCYLKSIGDERREGRVGATIQEKYSSIRFVQQTNNNNQQTLNARKKSC
jgi:hypothetical protein